MNRLCLAPLLLLAACSKPADKQAEPSDPAQAAGAASGDSTAAQTAQPDAAAAAEAGPVSVYTSLKDCKVIDDGGGEDRTVSRCSGPAGYALMLNYFDARETLDLVKDGKVSAELQLWLRGGGGFNALGDTVEWRGHKRGNRFVPAALIVRNFTYPDPERPQHTVAHLEVIDLAKGCVIDSVPPGAGQNAAARAIADGPPGTCQVPAKAQ